MGVKNGKDAELDCTFVTCVLSSWRRNSVRKYRRICKLLTHESYEKLYRKGCLSIIIKYTMSLLELAVTDLSLGRSREQAPAAFDLLT